MRPIGEDEAPATDDASEDVEEEEADIEEEITIRRRGRRRRRSKGKQYGSLGSMIAWMAFLIIWLFFFASGYGLFENIAVVLVALLIVGALNSIMWIPRQEGGWKARTSAISGVIWLIFLIMWFVFFSSGFGLYENIGIALASLLMIGAVNVGLWVPSTKEGGAGARTSAFVGIIWLIFIVLWLPFANNFSLIYPINPYQNISIVMTSFLLMVTFVIAPWRGEIRVDVEGEPGLYSRVRGSLVGFVLWIVFIDVWFWFLAGGFTGNQNVAVILLSFAIFCAIMFGLWLPWSRRRGEGPESWFSIGVAFVWVIVLALWFWFFADSFDAYQNFAVFLVSLLIVAAISGGGQWKKYRDFEAMDWDD